MAMDEEIQLRMELVSLYKSSTIEQRGELRLCVCVRDVSMSDVN